MLANFRAGGAAINVLAREAGVELVVVDAGVRAGTANIAAGPAMRGDLTFRQVRGRDGETPLRRNRTYDRLIVPGLCRIEDASILESDV